MTGWQKKPKAFSWSASALHAFETCPNQFRAVRVDKEVPYVQSPEAADGDRQHKAFELYIRDRVPLTPDLAHHQRLLDGLLAQPGYHFAEQELVLTRDFRITHWKDWDNAWFRCKADYLNLSTDRTRGVALDYKTGKVKAGDKNLLEQLELIALATFWCNSELQQLTAGLYWTKTRGIAERQTFTREDTQRIWAKFMPRVYAMEQALLKRDFPMMPSGLCGRWCDVMSCAHNGKGRQA